MKQTFDLNEALEAIKAGAKIDGKDGVLAPLIKQLTEAALEAELETHLSNEIRNRKNGKSLLVPYLPIWNAYICQPQ